MSPLPSMMLADIMTRKVSCIAPEASLREASARMAAHGISSLVVGSKTQPLGILTESNMLQAAHQQLPGATPVRAIMSHPVICAPASLDLIQARQLTARHHIHHLLVVDSAGHAIGIVSESDFRQHIGGTVFRHLRTLKGAMDPEISRLPPETPLPEAIARMAEDTLDYLLVTDGALPQGILTQRDIPRLLEHHEEIGRLTLAEVMSRPVHSISVEAGITEALDAMSRHRVRHMIVLDRHQKLVGVVSQRRLFERLALEQLETALCEAQQNQVRARLEAHLKLALDAADAGSWEYLHDQDRYLLSAGILHQLGCSALDAPCSQADWLERIHPDDRALMQAAVDTLDSGKSGRLELEYRMRRNDGRWVWFEDRGHVIETARNGRPLVTAGILANVDLRRKEQAVREEEQRRIARENQGLQMMSAFSQAFLRNNTVHEALHEICRQAVELGAYRGTQVVDRNGSLLAQAGAVAPLPPEEIIALPLNINGEPFCTLILHSRANEAIATKERAFLANLGDEISVGLSLLHSREAQASSEARLRASDAALHQRSLAIEQSPHSIIITDTRSRIEYVNEAFVRTTGYSREEAIGATPELLHSGLTPGENYHSLRDTLAQGNIWRGEFVNQRKDGSTYDEFTIIVPVRQASGEITHYLAIAEDITQKKRTQAELERHRTQLEAMIAERTAELMLAKEDAESANRAKSAFLANMSHEIRTPINAIIGLTHLVQREAESEEQRQRLGKVADAADHLLSIINDILDISKIEAGKLTLEDTDFDLQRVLATACNLVAERAERKRLPIASEIDPLLPRLLRGDPLRLQQIVVNFLSNAIKFTEQGFIRLLARQQERHDGTITLRCEVHDTGTGISPDIQARLFTPFEQGDTSTTRRFGGTGLGLAICQRLASAMGGRIGVRSTPGHGSTFWFTAHLHLAANAAPPEPGTQDTPGTWPAGTRLLLAEDNAINAEVAVDLLHSAGLSVDVVGDGEAAVATALRQPYDLILMDIEMPILDGLAAARRIRAQPAGARVPIVAMTANVFGEDRQRCFAAGMNDHIAKPVTPAVLFATLARWLPASPPGTPAPRPPTAPVAPEDDALRAQLAAIPGLDARFGLGAVRGRVGSYLGLLEKFTQGHGGDFAQIRSALTSHARDEARRLAHTLKGASGTLGATRVRDAAQALEHAIRNDSDAATCSPLIAALEAAYGQLRQAVQHLTVPAGEPADSAPSASPLPLLHDLRKLLNEGELQAVIAVRQNTPLLRSAFGAHFVDFEQAIANFDFESALLLLNQVLPGEPSA